MAKSKSIEQEPAIRKSFLITGGIALGAAVIGFVLMTFVLGGDDGSEFEDDGADTASQVSTTNAPTAPDAEAPATPKPAEPAGLTPGGVDPFHPLVGVPQASGATIDILELYGAGV